VSKSNGEEIIVRNKEEIMKATRRIVWILCGMLAVMTGCTTYYRVSDPGGTKEYYTTKIDKKGGGITFKDEKSGSVVTLQSSEVKEISEDEFSAAVKP